VNGLESLCSLISSGVIEGGVFLSDLNLWASILKIAFLFQIHSDAIAADSSSSASTASSIADHFLQLLYSDGVGCCSLVSSYLFSHLKRSLDFVFFARF
jgi:hypothetical protein